MEGSSREGQIELDKIYIGEWGNPGERDWSQGDRRRQRGRQSARLGRSTARSRWNVMHAIMGNVRDSFHSNATAGYRRYDRNDLTRCTGRKIQTSEITPGAFTLVAPPA